MWGEGLAWSVLSVDYQRILRLGTFIDNAPPQGRQVERGTARGTRRVGHALVGGSAAKSPGLKPRWESGPLPAR